MQQLAGRTSIRVCHFTAAVRPVVKQLTAAALPAGSCGRWLNRIDDEAQGHATWSGRPSLEYAKTGRFYVDDVAFDER